MCFSEKYGFKVSEMPALAFAEERSNWSGEELKGTPTRAFTTHQR